MIPQVVAGEKHRIVCDMRQLGTVTLVIFEQPWTSTLEVSSATLSRTGSNAIPSDLLGSQPLALDAAAFASFSDTGSDGCSGGRVWNECGSACDRTCDELSPMCTAVCVPRCECPRSLVNKGGACVPESECAPAMLGADGHGIWQYAPSPPVKSSLGANGHGTWQYAPAPPKSDLKGALGSGAALKAEAAHAHSGLQTLRILLALCVVACLVGAGWAVRSKLFVQPEAARGLITPSSSSEMATVSSSSEMKG